MFDIDLMQNFYKKEFERDAKTIDAWYTYVIHFLPFVNKKWRHFVSSDNLPLSTSMFKAITISDEALVQWLIILWIPIIKDRKSKNWILDEKDKKKGPHDTKHNINLYTQIHNELEMKRQNSLAAVTWNEIFWNEVKKKNKEQFEKLETTKKSKYSAISMSKNLLSLPGIDQDQDYLVDFAMKYDAAKTLKSFSPVKTKYNEEEDEEEDALIGDQHNEVQV